MVGTLKEHLQLLLGRKEAEMYYLLSIILGLLPEVLYYTLILINTKKLRTKRVLLFIFISLAYILCFIVKRYILIYYVLFVALMYISMKILYKKETQIIDIFIISFSTLYLGIISATMWVFLDNNKNYALYYSLYVINRILMFIPFIFKSKFNVLYKKYCLLWNRNDKEKRPIKSITLRNISLIIINFSIFLANILLLSIIN